MSCYCDSEEPSFYIEKFVKARRHRTCCECGGGIKQGAQYQVITGQWGGDIQRYKTCEPCADLREALSDVVCVPLKSLRDSYSDYLVEYGNVYNAETKVFTFPKNHMGLK